MKLRHAHKSNVAGTTFTINTAKDLVALNTITFRYITAAQGEVCLAHIVSK